MGVGVHFQLPAKLGVLREPHRYKVVYGGRGGGKSWAFAQMLLLLALRSHKKILCAREFQNSIDESVHALLVQQIERLRLTPYYQIHRNKIVCVNGSHFSFIGLHANTHKIKSHEGADICWVEEAEAITEKSWQDLIPTIRKEGSEIWISFNPQQDSDPTYKRFIAHPPEGAVVVKVGWNDNPWISETLIKEKDFMYATDPDTAAHVWGGETIRFGSSQILTGKWTVEAFDVDSIWDGPYHGADWGFARDPTTLVRCYIHSHLSEGAPVRDLYVSHEAYGVGVEITETPTLFLNSVPGADAFEIRADSARPETISYMQRNGFTKMQAAKKGQGSVADGIMFLRGFRKILIHPRCTHAREEAKLWRWKRDRLSGDILPVPVDAHNHIWDAVRYALEPIMRHEGETGLLVI